ncbi:transposase [Candidatus Acetothermia bacterium]|nr:transposase [Candidatus Acetothermia bacterium]
MVLEVLSGTKTNAEACREYQLKPEILSKWKTHFVENAARLFELNSQSNPEQARIAELERVVGRLTLQPWLATGTQLGSRVNPDELILTGLSRLSL